MIELGKNEEEVLRYWEQNTVEQRTRNMGKGRKPFYFLDGPPFVSGTLHPGGMWVKTMKDVFLRYRRYRGYDVYDRAGYDVHGLPIEKRAEQMLGITSKKEIESKIGVEKFIQTCKEYVNAYIGKMDADYKRFGISLDFSNPYIPSTKPYMEIEWGFLKRIHEKKLLYKSKSTTTFCKSCGTAVSQGGVEIEYREDTDPSLFVAFKVNASLSKPRISVDDNTYLVIWTTTPWTLPANMAVAVNPKERYVKARFGDRSLIVAKKRFEAVVEALGESAIVEGEFMGSEMEGIYYTSPLEEKVPMQKRFRKYHKVIFSAGMVSVEEGSGLLHTAPGHGLDDYNLGKENHLPLFSPVDTSGRYTEEAGAYAGLEVPEAANKTVLNDLKEKGALLNSGTLRHSYPHCWRCDTKLIYIATDQWKAKIQKVKKKLVSESNKVVWHPSEAQKWEEDLLVGSPDWTLSRQRYWGVPMPIWECECGEVMVIGSVAELREHALDKKYVDSLDDIHRPYIDKVMLKCKKCGGEMHRVKDVLDVWFDSSLAFRASLSEEQFNRIFPVDFVLEAVEMLRAWFSYQLKTSVMIYGKKPFRNVVTHGMMLGEDGRELHRKLGNYVPLEELLKTTSADAFRLWCTSHTPQLDLLFSREKINEASKTLLLLYNISNLLAEYSESIGYVPEKVKRPRRLEKLDAEDAWIVSRMNRLMQQMTGSLDEYEIYKAVNGIRDFIALDLSRFYLKAAKRKVLYSTRRKARETIDIINYLLFNSLVMISPFVPFTAEKVYLQRYAKPGESIFFNEWPRYKKPYMSDAIESDFEAAIEAITAILNGRERSGVKLRWPIAGAVVEASSDSAYESLGKLSHLMEDYTNVKKIEIRRSTTKEMEVRPNFSKLGPAFKQNAQMVSEALKGADAGELVKGIEERGYYDLHTEKGVVKVTAEHFTTIEKTQKENAILFKYGTVYIDPTISKELRSEALVREFERKVQLYRKELGLKKSDRIKLHYRVPVEYSEAINQNSKEVKRAINAQVMTEGIKEGMANKEFNIEDEKILLAVEKLG